MTFEGSHVGPVVFAPLRSEAGTTVSVSFGSVVSRVAGALGLTLVMKATFSLTSSPMKVVQADALRKIDLAQKKALLDVYVTGGAVARGADVRLSIVQRGAPILDVRRRASVGEALDLVALDAPFVDRLTDDPATGPSLVLPQAPDMEFFQCAPRDLRVPALDPDARLIVAGLLEGRPSVDAQLPSARAAGVIFGWDPSAPRQPMVLLFKADTLVINPDRVCVSVAWRTHVPLAEGVEIQGLTVGGGVATHEHPLRVRRRLEDLEIDAPARPARSREPQATIVLQSQGDSDSTKSAPAPIGSETLVAKSSPSPVSLPFDKDKVATPPDRPRPKRTRSSDGTMIGGTKAAQKTIPFTTEREREEARRRAEEALEAQRAAAAAEQAETERREGERQLAERKAEADRAAFAAEQARLAQVERQRRELAQKESREAAAKIEDALYGGIRKKKKT